MINLRYDVLRLCYHVDSADSEGWARVHIGFGVWASGHRTRTAGLAPPAFRVWRGPFKRDSSDHRHSRLRTDETLPLRPCRARLHLPANASDVGCSSCSPLRQPRSRDAPLARMAAAAHVPCPARPIGSPRLSRVRGCAHASCPPASGRHPLPNYEKGGFLVHVGIEFRCGLPC
jgi:LSD1 subclass zinc finger protein